MADFAVLFDMDGVLVHNNAYHKKSWYQYAEQLGFQLSEEDFKAKVYGKTNEEILIGLYEKALPEQDLVRMAEEKEALYRELYRPDAKPAEGLVPFLKALKAKEIPTGVATNAPKSNLDFTLDVLEIRSYFDQAIYARMVEKPKPAPDIYLKLMEMLDMPAERCIIMEDSLTGTMAGKEAGAKVAAITSTYSREELKQTGNCSLIFDSFNQLNVQQLKDVIDGV